LYQFDPLGYNTSDPHVAVKGTKQKNDRSPKIVRSIVPSVYFASSFYCAFGILTQKILFDPAHPMSFFFFPVLLTCAPTSVFSSLLTEFPHYLLCFFTVLLVPCKQSYHLPPALPFTNVLILLLAFSRSTFGSSPSACMLPTRGVLNDEVAAVTDSRLLKVCLMGSVGNAPTSCRILLRHQAGNFRKNAFSPKCKWARNV